jgi:hypothetical protein
MTLALVAALSAAPGEAGTLSLTNVRSTYGVLGAPRADNKILPGDVLTLSFDLDGVQTDDSGKIQYSVGMEVTDKAGKVHFKQAPRDLEAYNSLGGKRHAAFANLNVGLDQPPGEYTLKVTATDRTAKTSQTATYTYEVVPKAFGIVRLATSYDPDGQSPAAVAGEGQSLWVNFAAVGFERPGGKGQPQLTAQLRVLDESGQPTVAQPMTGEVKDGVPDKALGVPMQFVLELNRAGSYTIELKVTDQVGGKNATVSYPLTVQKRK